MQGQHRQQGMSLVEILLAALIFSFGVIGAASLLIVASRSNHSAFLRTQATFLAGSLADRMRINPVAVWRNGYDGDFPAKDAPGCDAAKPCAPMALADYDKAVWSRQLTSLLPDGKAQLTCSREGVGHDPIASDQLGMRPAYGGSCSLSIAWSGRAVIAEASDNARQQFHWVFQP